MSGTAGDPAEGEQIGPFRVVRRIGGGGMGVVLEAVDPALGRRVALKLLSGHLAEDDELRRRFTVEARALAALDSPHVVQVFAHGEHRGRPYLVTPLATDGDLAELIRREGPLPVRVALHLVGQVAAGLADAHAAGLLHRDVKPANVLLGRRGRTMAAYLGDFGVATRIGRGLEPGAAVGTPAWMAPELSDGVPAGVGTDVYSLGCLLWATLAGRQPYVGTTEQEVVAAHRDQPVPQLTGDSPLTDEVNRILRRAMAKDPSARYRAVTPMRDDLARAAVLPARSPQRGTGRPARIAVAAAVLVAGLAGPSAAPTVEPTHPASVAGAPVEATATAGLARALASRGVLGRAEARCTARRWIEEVGVRSMVDAGYFDAGLGFVDRRRTAMTTRIESAATAAARACADR